jgi:DNA-binding PadR family transcriptional regulator
MKKTKMKKAKTTKSEKKITKLSKQEPQIEFKGLLSFLILHEINTKKLAGEDLAKKIGKRKGSTLTPGTIYPALKKLKNNKLIKFEKKGRRKEYYLTEKGKKDLEITYLAFSKYFFGLKNKIKRVKRPKIIKTK